ncbi:MAG: FAD-dependent oxidoreductase [Planctomycetota bacterium]|jgi:quinone-modifying oxidoreductase subunit QmoB
MEDASVYVCAGCGIGEAVEVGGFEELCEEHGAGNVTTHPCLCSPEGVATIRDAVNSGSVGRVLVAACPARVKTEQFAIDPTRVIVERVDLREQVAWSHPPKDEDTQMLAEDQLRMGLTRLSKMSLPQPLKETIERTVLVVGGGLAGMQAALAAAGMGHPVVLVETADHLGGHLLRVANFVPDRPPYDQIRSNDIGETIARVRETSAIDLQLSTTVMRIAGQPGQFDVEVDGPTGRKAFKAGAVVQATGASPYDPRKLSPLGYGSSANIITANELESMLKDSVPVLARRSTFPTAPPSAAPTAYGRLPRSTVITETSSALSYTAICA